MAQPIDSRIWLKKRREFWQTAYLTALNSDRLQNLSFMEGLTRQGAAAREADAAMAEWDCRFLPAKVLPWLLRTYTGRRGEDDNVEG